MYGELVQLKQYTQKRGKTMAKTEIDVNQLPAGLTKKEFVNLPELKNRGAGSYGQELSVLSQAYWGL